MESRFQRTAPKFNVQLGGKDVGDATASAVSEIEEFQNQLFSHPRNVTADTDVTEAAAHVPPSNITTVVQPEPVESAIQPVGAVSRTPRAQCTQKREQILKAFRLLVGKKSQFGCRKPFKALKRVVVSGYTEKETAVRKAASRFISPQNSLSAAPANAAQAVAVKTSDEE